MTPAGRGFEDVAVEIVRVTKRWDLYIRILDGHTVALSFEDRTRHGRSIHGADLDRRYRRATLAVITRSGLRPRRPSLFRTAPMRASPPASRVISRACQVAGRSSPSRPPRPEAGAPAPRLVRRQTRSHAQDSSRLNAEDRQTSRPTCPPSASVLTDARWSAGPYPQTQGP